jgi:hypothetical protein
MPKLNFNDILISMEKPSLLFALFLISLNSVDLRSETMTGGQPASSTVPSLVPKSSFGLGPGASQNPMSYTGGLTPEESKLLGQARLELQKDPELVDLTNQIKALVEKRARLTEEKLQKTNPEASAILRKVKENQEKMQAERRAQAEAMQVKMKAQQEAGKTVGPADKTTPTTPALVIQATATPSP